MRTTLQQAAAIWPLIAGLVATGVPACQSRGARPPQPRWPLLADRLPDLDTLKLVVLGDTTRVYRTDVIITFDSGVPDAAKARFFERHALRVLGVTEGERFFVRIPDPGPSAKAFLQALERLQGERGVEGIVPILRGNARDVAP